MLYFDKIERERRGSLRLQIWTILHFPVHVAMLLSVEGNARLMLWAAAVQRIPHTDSFQISHYTSTFGTNGTKIAQALNKTLTSAESTATCQGSEAVSSFYTPILNQIHQLNLTSEEGREVFSLLLHEAWRTISVGILTTYGITVPEEAGTSISASKTAFDTLFATTLMFFFISGGCVLVFLNLLYWVSNQHRAKMRWRLMIFEILAGVGLGLVAVVRINRDAFKSFIFSPWPIPTMVLAYFTGECYGSYWNAKSLAKREQ
jgi:hypothetical protein